MIDMEKMAHDYYMSYTDKTRIYFIEKYFSTFNASVGRSTPFVTFPRQKVFLKSLAENNKTIAIKHRQSGISTLSSAWSAAQCVFASPESPEVILCIANKLEQAQELVAKIRDFLDQVPRWFWGDEYFSEDPRSEKNKKDIFVTASKVKLELFNGCKVYARASSPNAARGISAVSILIFDEAAFIEEGLLTYTSAVAATASNPNRKIIQVSTPNGKDELYYNTYRQALSKENGYNAVEFKWFQDLRYNKNLKWYRKNEESGETEWIIEPVYDETGTVKYDEEHWRKLEQDGWKPTNTWYEEMCRSFNNDPMMIAQELEVSFMGSANNVIAPQYIEMQETYNVREPLYNFKDPLVEETWFWKEPIEGHRYICACIPSGEQVLTDRGLVEVENVKSDDLLITKEGEFTKIKHRKYRECENEEIIKIKLYNIYDELTFTHNHPIWSSIEPKHVKIVENGKYIGYNFNFEFDYNNASELKKDDWVEVPNIYKLNKLTNDELLSKWYDIIEDDDINFESPILNEEFWWYCGIWLAEGYNKIKTNRIMTCHHIKENEIHERINKIIENIFNRKPYIQKKESNACVIHFNHKIIKKFLEKTFGKYSYGKYISEWVKRIPDNFKLKLFEGYFQGDGWLYDNKIYVSSVSKKLLNDFQDILFSLGIGCSVKLSRKEKIQIIANNKKASLTRKEYNICLGIENTKTFFNLLNGLEYKNNSVKKYLFFSNDLEKIYIRISKIEKQLYNGKVYNFETLSDSHSYCSRHIVSHNCDPSRGDAADRTAIEIIDMDGRDENGMPIIEQVGEYVGRKLGDDVGAMIVQYAKMYNDAFVVIDSTGGVGDSCILTILQLGYKNIYYEDANQKTYTVQNSTREYDKFVDKLPGFHFQGNRYPVLSNFAGLVRNNEFKIRSVRVINELDTWIFKGDTGRMDHQSGSHDDTITCLAMALFVMQYSLAKIESTKNRDAAILRGYVMNSGYRYSQSPKSSVSMTPNSTLPFYNERTLTKFSNKINGNFMWLLGGKR